MLLGSAVASLAAYFDTRKLFFSLAIISLLLTFTLVKEHQELNTTMDAMVATTVGVSFLAPRPQNVTEASSSMEDALSGLAPNPTTTIATANTLTYDWQLSTEENYRCDSHSNISCDGFFGEFREFRRRLDQSYHHNYIPSRQILQDTIIRSLLLNDNHCQGPSPVPSTEVKNCVQNFTQKQDESRPNEEKDTAPWIVFTAGVYGAGKSHTIGKLQSLGCFPPKSSFIGVDPDEIRRMLPEFAGYKADQAGALTQKEAGMIAELLTDIALSSGKNVVVDGSLRDAAWHEGYFQSLRTRFGSDSEGKTKNIRIGILYVTAPIDEIYLRVEQRGVSTGRSIPFEWLERSIKEVPEAIERLRPLADFFLQVHNSSSKNENEESKAESEQDSFASSFSPLFEGVRNEEGNFSELPTKIEKDTLGKSEIEATIFHEDCRSIVGY